MSNGGNNEVPILAREAALTVEKELWSGELADSVNNNPNDEQESRPMESHRTSDEDVIAREENSVVKDLIANELYTWIEKSLGTYNANRSKTRKSSIWSVVYIVFEQVMLDLLHKHVISDTLDAHISKLFDTYAAADRLSER